MAGPGPVVAEAITSRCPGELRGREPGLALVLDAERVDVGAPRLCDRQVGANRVDHPVDPPGLAGAHTERDDVLDLEVDRVADAHAVTHAVVRDVDRCSLDPEPLADERREPRHGPSELPGE